MSQIYNKTYNNFDNYVDIFGINMLPNLDYNDIINYYRIHSCKEIISIIKSYIVYYLKNNYELLNKILINMNKINIFFLLKRIKRKI